MSASGSSPRARGTPHGEGAEGCRPRFIPAGAGNTSSISDINIGISVHPRGRGEHGFAHALGNIGGGSSPRARGTPKLDHHELTLNRFIPAGAGNTTTPTTTRSMLPVHPRGRGEHGVQSARIVFNLGSSPRARGTHALGAPPGSDMRFIPAGAGNTHPTRHRAILYAVHPRGRGEHVARPSGPPKAGGSSPRARGTQGRRCAYCGLARFIPAGAGNTRCRPTPTPPGAVHPRGRGEHNVLLRR
mgnify:CR=1 FL=1